MRRNRRDSPDQVRLLKLTYPRTTTWLVYDTTDENCQELTKGGASGTGEVI